MKALIVEDNEQLRRMVIRLLRRMFPEVEPACAESADEAIDHLRNATLDRGFDLVICDFNLVGVRTGADVLAWIQEHASYLEERFLFLTSDERARALHPRFLEKPCDADVLRAAIEATVQRS